MSVTDYVDPQTIRDGIDQLVSRARADREGCDGAHDPARERLRNLCEVNGHIPLIGGRGVGIRCSGCLRPWNDELLTVACSATRASAA